MANHEILTNMLNALNHVKVKDGVVLMYNLFYGWVPLTRQQILPALSADYRIIVEYEKIKITFIDKETDKKAFVLHYIRNCDVIQTLNEHPFFKVNIAVTPGILDTRSGKYVYFSTLTYTKCNNDYYNELFDLIASGTFIRGEIHKVDGFQHQIYIINRQYVVETTEEVKIGENDTIIIGDQPAFSFYFNGEVRKLQNEHKQMELTNLHTYQVKRKIIDYQDVYEDYVITDSSQKCYTQVYKINNVWIGRENWKGEYELLNLRKMVSGAKTKAALAECHVDG
jgi:hypothetical protein